MVVVPPYLAIRFVIAYRGISGLSKIYNTIRAGDPIGNGGSL